MSLVLPLCTWLCLRGPYTVLRGIRVQMVRLSGVDSTQMCCIEHCLLQVVSGGLIYGCPLRFKICFKRRGERSRYSVESFDKLLVKSTKPNELSSPMDGGGRMPTLNDLDLFEVHVYSIFIDEVSAKRNSKLEER